MRGSYPEVEKRVLQIAGRFGFITQSIYRNSLCPLKRSVQYKHWRELIRRSVIVESKFSCGVFHLGRVGIQKFPGRAVPARSVYYYEHDEMVIQTLSVFWNSGLLRKFWTDRELRAAPELSLDLMGTQDLLKLPDLIMELGFRERRIRVAVEIERTHKSRLRYRQMALAYRKAEALDLVLFGCTWNATIDAIQAAFAGAFFANMHARPVVYSCADLVQRRESCVVRNGEEQSTLRAKVIDVLNCDESSWATCVETTWNSVHDKSTINEAA
jgi:hypothetical protein